MDLDHYALFFLEVVDHQEGLLRKESVFMSMEGVTPSWFLFFSMDGCGACLDYKPDIIQLASYFHAEAQ